MIDMGLPVVLDVRKPLSEGNMSIVFVQILDGVPVLGEAAAIIDEYEMGFFPKMDGASGK